MNNSIDALTNDRIKKASAKKYSFSRLCLLGCLMILLFRQSIMAYISAFIGKIGSIDFLAPFFTPAIVIIFLFFVFVNNLNKIVKLSDLFIPLFVIFAILGTYLFYPQNCEFLEANFWAYIFYCIPAYFIGKANSEYGERDFKVVNIFAYAAIVFSFLLLIYYNFMEVEISDDAMSLAYPVLIPLLIIIAHFFYKYNIIDIVFIIIGFLYLFMMGTRGPILIGILYLSFCFIVKRKHKLLIALFVGIILLIFIQSNAYLVFLKLFRNFIETLGYSTRVLDSMINGKLIEDSSRMSLYSLLLSELQEKPYLGYGLFGEWKYYGWNAHNIYLEVVFEYGWPLGVALIIYYLFNVFLGYLKAKNESCKYLISILIFFVLVQGFIGYSHLRPELFLLLGLCIGQNRKNERYNNERTIYHL